MTLTRLALSNPVAAVVAVLLVLLFGTIALVELPVQMIPSVVIPRITIETPWRAAAPEDFGDRESQLFETRVDVHAGSWIVGESVRLDVPTAKPKQALAVPRDALILRSEGAFVYRVGVDQTAERVPVTTGAGDGDLIEVEGDLAPDDTIVVRGGERLLEGQPVMVTEG